MMNKFKDIIVDMDGTLADIHERVERAEANPPPGKRMNWDIFLNERTMMELDEPNEHVIELVRALHSTQHRIIITSARNERHREVTEVQLLNWFGFKVYQSMYLRKDNDFRSDNIVKEELLEQIRADGYDPHIAIDDRQQVVDHWRKLGLKCWQVEKTDV